MTENPQAERRARVLVVDDERSIRISVCTFLTDAGYEADMAEEAEEAQRKLTAQEYDVIVSDIVLPRISGVALLQKIRESAPDVQVIMMTGEPTVDTAAQAVRAGASDYLTKPVGKEAILRSVATAARMKHLNDDRQRLAAENESYQRNLEQLVRERTQKLEEAITSWKNVTEGTIRAMASAVESRDPYTAGHQRRVAALARAIAEHMDLPEDRVSAVYHAGLIHDLGKISVPAEILSNPGKLCDEAMNLIKKHPASAHHILENVQFPWPLAEIVLEHHERIDGSGYPRGLSGEAISQEARILAVADVVEAMASHRPYRAALGIDTALLEIERGRGIQYDTAVVDACLSLFRNNSFSFEQDEPRQERVHEA